MAYPRVAGGGRIVWHCACKSSRPNLHEIYGIPFASYPRSLLCPQRPPLSLPISGRNALDSIVTSVYVFVQLRSRLLTIKIQSLTINSRKSCIYSNAVGGWENIQLFQGYTALKLFKRMLIGTLCISATSVRINIPFRLLLSFYYNARLRIITLPL